MFQSVPIHLTLSPTPFVCFHSNNVQCLFGNFAVHFAIIEMLNDMKNVIFHHAIFIGCTTDFE
jgi:hypothetical protein